jgi:uncharacterized membrane protein YsdA (DUF1294 family)
MAHLFESKQIILAIIAVAVWNIITFTLYGADKRKARKNHRRISETTLILCAFLMGGAGAILGMKVFRHKTKHWKFKILVPLALLLNILTAALILHHFEIFDLIGLWQ